MRFALVVAGVLLGASLAGSSAAQGVGEPVKPRYEQQQTQPQAYERKTGVPLVCKSASQTDETAYQCKPKGEPPTAIERAWRWIFRAGRDPIAVLTLLLFGVGVWQIGIAQRTAHRQLRAYVHAFPGVVNEQNAANSFKFEVRPNIINKGQTPAYDVQYSACLKVVNLPLAPGFNFAVPEQIDGRAKATLGPDQSSLFWIVAEGYFSEAEIKLIKGETAGAARIMAYGEITYRDAFNKRHFTQFAWVIGWDGGAPIWVTHPGYQEAT